MDTEKQIRWVGSAYDDLLAFPEDARKEAGFQLGKVQFGLAPADWKPFDEQAPACGKFGSGRQAARTA